MVSPILSDRCLSVCDVGVLRPNGWMDQDELGMQVAGRPRSWPHCVRRRPISPPPKGRSRQFSAHICCSQMAEWIKMPLGMEVVFGPGDFVLDGNQASPPQKGGTAPSPIFGPCLLWPNGCMDQYAIWYGGRPRPRRRCVRWGPSSPFPIFGRCLLWPNGRMNQDGTWHGGGSWSRPY